MSFSGKNILITGAAKGIGREIALACANQGANLAIHYQTSEQEAIATVDEIQQLGVSAIAVQADLANYQDVANLKKQINERLGTVDSIVNNAGWAQTKSFFKYKPEEWKREVDVCFHGVLNLAYEFIPDMQQQNSGKFINIIGDSARTGDRNLIISAAARGGAISFMKSLAKEVGRNNIQCNTLALGLIDKGDLAFDQKILERIVKQYPLNRLGEMKDVVGPVLFLLSEDSDWITGQVLSVNGGYSMIG